MSKNTSTGGETEERHDVTITYTNGKQEHFPDMDGDTARDLENSAFTLPGVVVVEAQAKQ